MSNTLTGLIPVIYEALDVVARERIGFIPAVTIDAAASMAALNQTVRSPVAPVSAKVSNSPSNVAPNTGGQTISYKDTTISSSYSVPIAWTGEEQLSVKGIYESILRDQFAQAFRTLSNAVESDLATTARNASSRAVGTAGTAPFGSSDDMSVAAQAGQILSDNGAPQSDRHLVVNTSAMANLQSKQPHLFKVNEAGTAQMLTEGTMFRVMGFDWHTSAQVNTTTKGTGGSYVLNGTGATGATSLVNDVGSGTVVAGDVITLSGDTNNYVVNTGEAAAGTIVLNAPGLLQLSNDDTAITVGNTYAANVAFQRAALLLVARQPAMPAGGDAATDVIAVTDPVSGITFQIAMYRQYRQIHIEVGLAWGTSAIKSEFISTIMG